MDHGWTPPREQDMAGLGGCALGLRVIMGVYWDLCLVAAMCCDHGPSPWSAWSNRPNKVRPRGLMEGTEERAESTRFVEQAGSVDEAPEAVIGLSLGRDRRHAIFCT